jgi:hypothetical protein
MPATIRITTWPYLNDLKEGDLPNRWRELDRLAELGSAILADTDAFIDRRTWPARIEIRRRSHRRDSARGRRFLTSEIGELLVRAHDCLPARIILAARDRKATSCASRRGSSSPRPLGGGLFSSMMLTVMRPSYCPQLLKPQNMDLPCQAKLQYPGGK